MTTYDKTGTRCAIVKAGQLEDSTAGVVVTDPAASTVRTWFQSYPLGTLLQRVWECRFCSTEGSDIETKHCWFLLQLAARVVFLFSLEWKGSGFFVGYSGKLQSV